MFRKVRLGCLLGLVSLIGLEFSTVARCSSSEILLNVVLGEGDAAFLKLSLVCPKFKCLVETNFEGWHISAGLTVYVWILFKSKGMAGCFLIFFLSCLFLWFLISLYRCYRMENKV